MEINYSPRFNVHTAMLMRPFILLLLLLSCTFVETQAQLQPQSPFRIGIEYGSHEIRGKIDNRWEFRHPDIRYSRQTDLSGSERVSGKGNIHYAGVKSEFSVWDNRLTFTTGLRYTLINEQVSPQQGTFIYLFHPSSQGIELFRIKGMEERLGYAGIPLEGDFLLWGRHSNWQGYLKAGIEGGVKIHGETSLNFLSEEMEQHGDAIISTAGAAPSRFFLNSYAGLGLRLILQNGIRLSAEITLPPHYLTKGNLTLLTPEFLGGSRFSVTMPTRLFSLK